jgi:hypothetical protein
MVRKVGQGHADEGHGGGQDDQGEGFRGKDRDSGWDCGGRGADQAGGVFAGDEQGAQDGDGQHPEVEAAGDDLGAVHLLDARGRGGVVGHGVQGRGGGQGHQRDHCGGGGQRPPRRAQGQQLDPLPAHDPREGGLHLRGGGRGGGV